jgi:hypothetical protein
MLFALVFALASHADAPSPSAALTLFQHDAAVRGAIRVLESDGYALDGEAGAALYSTGFGDEGYCSEFLASQPLAKGNRINRVTKLVTARVRLCWPEQKVELVNEVLVKNAVRELKKLSVLTE